MKGRAAGGPLGNTYSNIVIKNAYKGIFHKA